MPRRRKYATLTKRDINNLKNFSPMRVLILIGAIMVACYGDTFIFSFETWLQKTFRLSSNFAFYLSVFVALILLALTIVLIIGIPIVFATKRNQEIEKRYKAIQIANIDSMPGLEFEYYLERLLTHQGFSTTVTKASGDLGVDLIASRNSDKIAIQAKRYDTKVSRRAISDAVAGMSHYGCNKAMVITNNYFTPDAVKLARSTDCTLIDRDTLATWIIEYQNTKQ